MSLSNRYDWHAFKRMHFIRVDAAAIHCPAFVTDNMKTHGSGLSPDLELTFDPLKNVMCPAFFATGMTGYLVKLPAVAM